MELGDRPQSNEIRRQEIISGSPTMQAILARDITQPFLNDQYIAMQQAVMEAHRANSILRRLLGSDELKSQARNTIDMMVDNSRSLLITAGFIDPLIETENKEAYAFQKRMLEIMFLVGFEMDDADDARLIVDDVTQYLEYEDNRSNGKFFSDTGKDMLRGDDGRYFMKNMAYQIILFGLNMRVWQTRLPLKGDSQQPGDNGSKKRANEDANDPIKDFINTLPGLDNL